MLRVFIIVFTLGFFTSFSVSGQLNTTLHSTVTYSENLSDIWGYSAGGKEYALVAQRTGLNIQDVTDPANPIDLGTATGPPTSWRDIKTFGNYAYVVLDVSATGGMLIVDLSNLPNALTASDWSYWNPTVPGLGEYITSHNIFIDDIGYAYICGGNWNNGGVVYLDLFTTPGTPIYVDKGPAVYAHDVYVQNDIMFTSDINNGEMTMYNVADKTNTVFLGNTNTPNNFTHNAWPNATGTIVFTTDEKANAYTTAYDVSDPNDITELDRFRPLATVGTGVFPHNVHVAGDFLVISHYSDGVIIVDASVPSNLIEVGNYDTYTGSGTGYNGAWGAYPYLPSGNILVSDQGNGLFIIDPTYVNAARVEGLVTDHTTGNPIAGATIVLNASQANTASTDILGSYKTGVATAGTYQATISKSGYVDVIQTVTISNGVITPLNVVMGAPLPLDILQFSADKNNESEVALSWTGVQSEGVFEFDVFRSGDGRRFEKIATVSALGEAGVEKDFIFYDRNPLIGKNYYKLGGYDSDRSVSFTQIEEVDFGNPGAITLYPNPMDRTATDLIIEGDFHLSRQYNIRIYNSLGQENRLVILGEDLRTINADLLFPGVNILEIEENGNQLFVGRVLKN